MCDKVFEINYLFDVYGNLLSDKQYNVVELYYIHDLSLSEISEVLNVSRQGVFDTLKRAEKKLYEFENKLGLVEKFSENKLKITKILEYVRNLNTEYKVKNSIDITEDLKTLENNLMEILGISQEGNL